MKPYISLVLRLMITDMDGDNQIGVKSFGKRRVTAMTGRCNYCHNWRRCRQIPVEIDPEGTTAMRSICEDCDHDGRVAANQTLLSDVIDILNAICDGILRVTADEEIWLNSTATRLNSGYVICEAAQGRIEKLHREMLRKEGVKP